MKWLMDEVSGVDLLSPSRDGNGRWEVNVGEAGMEVVGDER